MRLSKSFLMSSISCFALMMTTSACATIKRGRDTIVENICENKSTLLAVAMANGDIASVKAIEAYCPDPASVATEAAKTAEKM